MKPIVPFSTPGIMACARLWRRLLLLPALFVLSLSAARGEEPLAPWSDDPIVHLAPAPKPAPVQPVAAPVQPAAPHPAPVQPVAAPNTAPAAPNTAPAAPEQSISGGFETFAVPKTAEDINAARKTAQAAIADPASFPTQHPRLNADRASLWTTLTLQPTHTDLSLMATGMWNRQPLEAQINPLRWLRGDFRNSGYWQSGSDRNGLRFGDIPLFGNTPLFQDVQGIRLLTPLKSSAGSIGLGLYQQSDLTSTSTHTMLAADTQWHFRKNWTGTALVGSDASWAVSQQVTQGAWQFSGQIGRNARSHLNTMQGNFAGLLGRSTSLQGSVLHWSGAQGGQAYSLGISQRIGSAYATLDNSLIREQNQTFQMGVGLFVPLRRSAFSMHIEHITTSPISGHSLTGSAQSNIFTSDFSTTLDSKTNLWVNGTAALQSQSAFEGSLAVGAQHAFTNQWSGQVEALQDLHRSRLQMRAAVDYRINNDWQVQLSVDPSQGGSLANQPLRMLGLQIAHRFGITQVHEGTVRGRVMVDGKPCDKKMQIVLDDNEVVETDSRGRFQYKHIPVGNHKVQVQATSVSADMDVDKDQADVKVRQGRSEEIVFNIRHVEQLQGMVHMLPDAFGQVDPTGAVGVRVVMDTGQTATTNADNVFRMGNLTPGKCRLKIDASTLPPDCEVVGPDSTDIVIETGKPMPSVEFTIAPRRRKVIYEDAPQATPESQSVHNSEEDMEKKEGKREGFALN